MEVATECNPKPSPKPLALLGRDEMNLAEFPITLLTDRVPKDQKEAIYQDEIYDDRTGLTLSRKLTIQAGNCGLTTAIDDEVILALIQMTKHKHSFSERKIYFTRLELIKILGWPNTGQSYDRIKTSFDRWTSVYLQYENAWRDNRTKTWKTIGFHIIDNFELNDSRTNGEQLDLIPSFIVWNEVIFDSFQAGYLKPLDYDLCMGLSNSTAKRLYRFLDKRFHHKTDWTFDLKELAHEHIGLSRNYEGTTHLKRKLEPAIDELEKVGVLLPLPDGDRFPRNGRTCKVRLIQKSPALASPPQTEPPSDTPPLVAELVKRGVTDATAADLVKRHPAEAIEHQLDVFDWMMDKHDKRIAKSPAGYLVKAIATGYKEPAGFVTRAERQSREEAKRQAEEKAAEARRQEQEQQARNQAMRRNINTYLKQLDQAGRIALEAEALAAASPADRESYESHIMAKFRDTLMLGMIRNYLAGKPELELVAAEA
jgi:Replication initiator protein A